MLPQLLIQSLQNAKGFNEESFIAAHAQPQPVTSIRYNALKPVQQQNANTQPVAWCKYGVYLPQRPFFTHDPLLHCGAYYVQEASSMFLWQILEQHIGSNTQKTVLDLCAAPGGKSTLLANYFTNGLVVANETIQQRSHILVENITKWGADNVIVTNNDAQHFKRLSNFFDVIVVDAPCSGSGLFRKDADAINEWSEANVNLCSQRQQRILSDIIHCLKNDGILIYSTCSYSPQENEEIVDWLIENHHLTSLPIQLKNDWGVVETQSTINKGFGYRFYPYNVKGEGFFIAAFKNETNEKVNEKRKENILPKPSKQEIETVTKLIDKTENCFLFKHNNAIKLFNSNWQKQLQVIANELHIKKAGIEAGTLKGKDFVPHHELAMSYFNCHVEKITINKLQALQYLSKKEVIIHTNFVGLALLQYANFNLGWIKILNNRNNNYYPTEWRILNTNFEANET